jgi:hypothetical protein
MKGSTRSPRGHLHVGGHVAQPAHPAHPDAMGEACGFACPWCDDPGCLAQILHQELGYRRLFLACAACDWRWWVEVR